MAKIVCDKKELLLKTFSVKDKVRRAYERLRTNRVVDSYCILRDLENELIRLEKYIYDCHDGSIQLDIEDQC